MATSLFWKEWQYEQGIEEMAQCLELDPNAGRNRALYGHMLMILGRPEEAREQGEQAAQLDPRDPSVTGLYGTILALSGPPEQAIEVLEAMLEENPGAGFGYSSLATAYRRIGQTDEEIRTWRTDFALAGWDWAVTAIDRGMEAGDSREARRRTAEALADHFEEAPGTAATVALFYRDAGEVEEALDWLERSLAQHEPNLPYLSFWGWDESYDHPRFQAVAEEVGVPLLGR
jgi:tetratricopeptide (TPR) repeat protein